MSFPPQTIYPLWVFGGSLKASVFATPTIPLYATKWNFGNLSIELLVRTYMETLTIPRGHNVSAVERFQMVFIAWRTL